MRTRRKFSPELKAQIVLEILKEEKSMSQMASEHEIHPVQLSQWKTQAIENFPQLFIDDRKGINKIKKEYEQTTNELYAEVGKLTTQLAWLKKKSGLIVD
jgi:transposase